MTTIWKFEVPIRDVARVEMPSGARVLSVQAQRGIACVWAVVDHLGIPIVTRTFYWRGTGCPMGEAEGKRFVGTIQLSGGDLVFHLFEDDDA